MAAATYATDLTLIDAADAVGNYTALGGGQAGLNDETDYFIETPQCVSKNGFTASTRGFILNTGTTTVASGDAIFVWGKQNNRNLMDTVAAGGMQFLVGDSTSAYDHFYVDGSDSAGSALAGWRTYAVDPTQTPSTTTGSPTTTNRVGFLWKILGSGSLKGAPNGMDISRHGRELTVIDGDLANGYANFDDAAVFDNDPSRAWGILTPVAGGYQHHGAFVMGTASTAADFRDENRNIVVLDDLFVPAGFNEFEIRNASTNVEWTGITIQHLGTTSPALLTLNVGTFTGVNNRFAGCSTTTFASTSSCIGSQWQNSDRINLNQADISGSSILTPTVAADEGAVFDDRTTTGATSIAELDNCTFSQGTNAHHAIRFGANVDDDITLTGIEFTGFSASNDVNGSTLRFDATSGSINVNLIDCTVDGNPATTSNVGVDDAAGITVTLVVNPVTTKVTVVDSTTGSPISGVRVLAETADNGGGSGFPYKAGIDTISISGTTATVTMLANHGLATNDYVVIRKVEDNATGPTEGYNKQAQITVTGAATFTYTVASGLEDNPEAGLAEVSYCPLSGTTNGSGVIQSSKTWPASQSVSGRCRKSTSSPFYKTARFTIADASAGSDISVPMILDE